jgi:hypothetical protein
MPQNEAADQDGNRHHRTESEQRAEAKRRRAGGYFRFKKTVVVIEITRSKA